MPETAGEEAAEADAEAEAAEPEAAEPDPSAGRRAQADRHRQTARIHAEKALFRRPDRTRVFMCFFMKDFMTIIGLLY